MLKIGDFQNISWRRQEQSITRTVPYFSVLSRWLKFFTLVSCFVQQLPKKKRFRKKHRDNGIIRSGDIKFSVGLVPLDFSILKRNPERCARVKVYIRIGAKQFTPWNRPDGCLEAEKIRVLLSYRGSQFFPKYHRWTGKFSSYEITWIPCFFHRPVVRIRFIDRRQCRNR